MSRNIFCILGLVSGILKLYNYIAMGKSKKLAAFLAAISTLGYGCQSLTVNLPSVAHDSKGVRDEREAGAAQTAPVIDRSANLAKIPTKIPTPLVLRMAAAQLWINKEHGRNWCAYLRKYPLNDEEVGLVMPVAVDYLQKLGCTPDESRYVAVYYALRSQEMKYARLSPTALQAYSQEQENFRKHATEETIYRAYDTIYTFLLPFIGGAWPKEFENLPRPKADDAKTAAIELSAP